MKRRIFYDTVRADPFGGAILSKQFEGMEAILDEWEKRRLTDLRWLAYMLATAFHETARTMQPIKEYGGRAYFMEMYDKSGSRPHVARRLGNTQVGDGARFCGRGYVQLTGRANYEKAAKQLGVDFVRAPELTMHAGHAAAIMFEGMIGGWFTGKRLASYFAAGKADWRNARRIINGLDRASTIADFARAFHKALCAAHEPIAESGAAASGLPMSDVERQSGAEAARSERPPDIAATSDLPTEPPEGGFFDALMALLARILRRN